MDQLFFMSTQQSMVDDLQELNDDLLKAKVELESSQRVREAFFNHVSHEMRTPLNGVISALALVPEASLPPESKELVQLANHSAHRLMEVINFSLESAAWDAGTELDSPIDMQLEVLLEDVVDLVKPRALEKALPVNVDLDKALSAPVRIHEGPLRNVLTNLLGNASSSPSRAV